MRRHTSWAAVAALLLVAASARAQTVLHREDAIEVRTQLLADLDTLDAKFTALANAFPEDKYSWRPEPGVRSVGEVFMHVAYTFYTSFPFAYGGKPSPDLPQGKDGYLKFEQVANKATVLKHVAAGPAYAKAAVQAADLNTLLAGKTVGGRTYSLVEISFLIETELHEHLGQLIAYARMNGITPPWNKKP